MRDNVRTKELGRWTFGLLPVFLLAAGCATTGAPSNWLPVPEDAPRDPYGAWITVEFVDSKSDQVLAGEFLAVGPDSLFVLVNVVGLDPVFSVALSEVAKATIAHFDPETGKASNWVATGSLASLSHGFGALISLPLWLIGGSSMAGSQSRTPLEYYPESPWEELRMYARFPQGPPPNLHRLGLRAKTVRIGPDSGAVKDRL